ncbi:MAG: hypothetical protein ACRELY_13450, partial [Polyangiaceae bacterium]
MKSRSQSLRRLAPLFVLLAPLSFACGGGNAEIQPCPHTSGAMPATASDVSPPKAAEGPPTPEEAAAFIADVETNLRKLWVARDRAGWVQENFITDDTE